MKIRWRLTWYGIGFTAISLIGFIVLINVLVVGTAQQDQDDLLSGMADEAVATLSTVGGEKLAPSVPPVLPDASTSDQPFITVYDESGVTYYATGVINGSALDLPGAVIVEAIETGASFANVSGVRTQVRRWESQGVGTGVVAASQSERVIDDQLRGLRWFLIIFGLIALAAAAIGAWFMAGRALRPVKLLAETTDDIGATGDLSRRLPPVRQHDEVGALTDSFNAMLDGIETARRDRDLTIDAQKRFVADASHELRSPLTSIRANAGFLVDRRDVSDVDRSDAIRDIALEADRMSNLIDDLLTLARADIRKDVPIELAPVDLAAVARSVERRARNLRVNVTVDAPDSLVVAGNAEDLAELIWILVDNADRHGGDAVVVRLAASASGATIEVTDDGRGIPEEDLDRIFDRFHRADSARSGPGHGLGLAIARSVVERWGGTIYAGNGPSGGAVFTIVLPATP
ncbi:MAG: HAMP domain-containing sensor histidine kinase [Acidimicrobiia bacterium]|nr:MAG: HAMP domain-containing sensor histidine kinase [Acidimicrobiia bacterium]